jgi:DNA-binding winged helix-turn-helix (wHTH) protein
MKIVFNSSSNELTNQFINLVLANLNGSEAFGIKGERALFEEISKENTDAYILENTNSWTQKAIDFIKKRSPYVPIIALMYKKDEEDYNYPRGAEFYIFNPDGQILPKDIYESTIRTIQSYHINFDKLQKLTAKMKDEIEFEKFKYDPVRRNFRFEGALIKKMSPKEGGVLEILAANFGNVVKKEIIMEKVWHNVDFYVGRSMDVYITNLRNLFKEKRIPLTIKNIHNAGLILENED